MEKLWETQILNEGILSFECEVKICSDNNNFLYLIVKKIGSTREWPFILTEKILKDLRKTGSAEEIIFDVGYDTVGFKVLEKGTAYAKIGIISRSYIEQFKGLKTFKIDDILSWSISVNQMGGCSRADFELNRG